MTSSFPSDEVSLSRPRTMLCRRYLGMQCMFLLARSVTISVVLCSQSLHPTLWSKFRRFWLGFTAANYIGESLLSILIAELMQLNLIRARCYGVIITGISCRNVVGFIVSPSQTDHRAILRAAQSCKVQVLRVISGYS
jgi:hypothetical protein